MAEMSTSIIVLVVFALISTDLSLEFQLIVMRVLVLMLAPTHAIPIL